MKKFSRKKLWTLLAFALAVAACMIPFLAGKGNDTPRIDNRYSYRGILTLYSLDAFEGGVNSRADFLNRAAVAFEKKNKGVFVQVYSVTPYELQDRLSRGAAPDILLYSYGYYQLLSDRFAEYSQGVHYYDNLRQGDSAVPIWLGGYFGFSSNAEYPYVCGEGEYNNPALAALLAGKPRPERGRTQKEAYEDFVFRKFSLIGTQRDVFRLQNSERELKRETFANYTDLVQYGSVIPITEQRSYFSQRFLEYLTSPEIQGKLDQIGMCSVTGIKLYDGVLGEFENKISNLSVPKLDRSPEEIKAEREDTFAAFTNSDKKKELTARYGK